MTVADVWLRDCRQRLQTLVPGNDHAADMQLIHICQNRADVGTPAPRLLQRTFRTFCPGGSCLQMRPLRFETGALCQQLLLKGWKRLLQTLQAIVIFDKGFFEFGSTGRQGLCFLQQGLSASQLLGHCAEITKSHMSWLRGYLAHTIRQII